jgi:hypothetical protein
MSYLRTINLLTIHLSLKQINKAPIQNTYIPPSMVDSYVRLCTQDGGIFMQLFRKPPLKLIIFKI